MNPHVSPEEARYAGGFSNSDNTDKYFRPCPGFGIVSANALCNWPYPRAKVHPPNLVDSLWHYVHKVVSNGEESADLLDQFKTKMT